MSHSFAFPLRNPSLVIGHQWLRWIYEYVLCPFGGQRLIVSTVNGLQTLSYWQNAFHHPSTATLGLLNAIFSVGQVVGLPLVPFLADNIGRKWTILFGSSL